MRGLIVLGVLAIIALILINGTFYSVDETQFVVVKRFGEIQQVEFTPGLRVKTPFIDQVVRLDKRLLHIDVPVATMPDVEKQNLEIDAYAAGPYREFWVVSVDRRPDPARAEKCLREAKEWKDRNEVTHEPK